MSLAGLEGCERRDHAPRAVDVIDAPAAVPRAPRLLRFAQIFTAARHVRVAESLPSAASISSDVRRDVLGRRIDHRAEIRERHVVEQFARVVAIECRPGAVAASPSQASSVAHARPAVTHNVAVAAFEQREHDDRRVVDVGIGVVVEFECPAVAAAFPSISCASRRARRRESARAGANAPHAASPDATRSSPRARARARPTPCPTPATCRPGSASLRVVDR